MFQLIVNGQHFSVIPQHVLSLEIICYPNTLVHHNQALQIKNIVEKLVLALENSTFTYNGVIYYRDDVIEHMRAKA